MKLTRVLLLSVLFITLFAVTAGAMPDVVWPGDGGNTSGLS